MIQSSLYLKEIRVNGAKQFPHGKNHLKYPLVRRKDEALTAKFKAIFRYLSQSPLPQPQLCVTQQRRPLRLPAAICQT